jgi:hypothetical protein
MAAAVESVVSVVPELPLVIVLLPPPVPPAEISMLFFLIVFNLTEML